MSEFRNVSILIGAVTETDSLRKTVDTVLGLCSHEDLSEIMICYPDRVTPECLAVINELTARGGDVPVISFEQTYPFMSFIVEMIEKAKGSHCITVDSDLALDLTLIPQMIEGAKKEYRDILPERLVWGEYIPVVGYKDAEKIENFIF